MEIEKALQELRKLKPRKFIQTVDLVVNLQDFDARKEAFNIFAQIPNSLNKKLCGFLTKKSSLVDTITQEEFKKYKEKKEMKILIKKYDFFISAAKLMPAVATQFGRVLGPVGKMPSPQAGIIPTETEDTIKQIVEKMSSLIRIRVKEKSIKVPIGKEDLEDKKLGENIQAVLKSIEKALPRGKQNIKNVMVKFTMTKPVKIKF